VRHPHVNLYDLDRKKVYFRGELILLRPSLRKSPHAYSRCQVAIVATPDMKRVFVGESEYEFPQIAYEADTLTIEALAERLIFPSFGKHFRCGFRSDLTRCGRRITTHCNGPAGRNGPRDSNAVERPAGR
jgi:hypothetical protein